MPRAPPRAPRRPPPPPPPLRARPDRARRQDEPACARSSPPSARPHTPHPAPPEALPLTTRDPHERPTPIRAAPDLPLSLAPAALPPAPPRLPSLPSASCHRPPPPPPAAARDERGDHAASARRPPGATAPRAPSARAGSSIASTRSSSTLQPLATSPSPSRSIGLMVVRLVACTSSPQARAASEPGARRTSWSASSNEPRGRRWSPWPTSSGRCWISVPPSATFSSCMPRQIPSSGRSRAIARARERGSRPRRARAACRVVQRCGRAP